MTTIILDSIKYIDDVMEIELNSFSLPWTQGMFADEFTKDIAFYVGVQIDNKIIAYAGMWKIFDEGHITNIAVSPDYRRRGLGKILINALIEEALKCNIKSMTLEVRESNNPAISLYNDLGFEVAGKRKAYYEDNKEDALIMWKIL